MGKARKILLLILSTLIEWVIADIPGPIGRRLRRLYWSRRLKHIGQGVQIDVGVRIVGPEYISIGDNCWIDNYVVLLAGPPTEGGGPIYRKDTPGFRGDPGEIIIESGVHLVNFVVVQGHGGVQLGHNSSIANGGMVYSMSHHHSNLVDRTDTRKFKFTPMVDRSEQSLICRPVVIGDDCAVGLNSVVLPGTQVGHGTWIGSGSVVSGKFPGNALVMGNPAEVKKLDLNPGWSPPDRSDDR